MTNATKTLAILFAASLLLAVAVRWGGGSDSSAAFQTQLLAVDTSEVQSVRIERTNRPSLRFTRSEGSWSVAPSDTSATFPASAQSVQRMLGTLPSLEVSAVATRQSDKHARYGVDSTGTQVTMLDANDEPLGQLIVGRTQMKQPSGGRQQNPMQRRRRPGTPVTYVRSPDAPDVFSVEQALGSIVNQDVEAWRDKQIWALDQANIQQVEFSYPADSSFTIGRVADTTSSAWISEGDTLATSEVTSLLRTVSTPSADGFADGLSPEALSNPRYTVHLQLADGSRRSLQFYPTGDDNQYHATATDYPYVVELRASRWDRSVLQGRTALLQDN